MSKIIPARLDGVALETLSRLEKELDLSRSEIIRRAIIQFSATVPQKKRRIHGIGIIDSGISDLGHNKQHLKGLGKWKRR